MKPRTYRDATAFRVALEVRLRQTALERSVPLDRLRKEVAHQRFLARLALTAPAGTWALKGGQALLARLGEGARVTKDTDATWRGVSDAFAEVLEQAVDLDLADFFTFEVGEPRKLAAETEEGGLRYSITASLDGRRFERLQLDVNFVPHDPRPLEFLRLRDVLDFAGIEPPKVPIVSVAQHLAEKLHAYTRDYGVASSRPRDLFDMLIVAHHLPLPSAGDLVEACRLTFGLRGTRWPPELRAAPDEWKNTWQAYAEDYGTDWPDLESAERALRLLVQPLLEGDADSATTWDAASWGWRSAGSPRCGR